jgi:hypothetical protein
MKKLIFVILFMTFNAMAFDQNHSVLSRVLEKHVRIKNKQTLVDYRAIKKDPKELNSYLDELSKVTNKEYESWSDKEKLSTLINAYNAWTIRLIIDHYPVTSIRKIGPFYSSPWKITFVKWLGKKISLDEIENDIIRKKFNEPRIHFALVCASIGCPPLPPKPFIATNLNTQLASLQSAFLLDQSKNNFKLEKQRVILNLSSIFKWYGDDFGDEDSLTKLILKEMGLETKAKGKKVDIRYLDYDWSLNEAK